MTYDHWKCTDPADGNEDPRDFEYDDPNPCPCETCDGPPGIDAPCDESNCIAYKAWEEEERHQHNLYNAGRLP